MVAIQPHIEWVSGINMTGFDIYITDNVFTIEPGTFTCINSMGETEFYEYEGVSFELLSSDLTVYYFIYLSEDENIHISAVEDDGYNPPIADYEGELPMVHNAGRILLQPGQDFEDADVYFRYIKILDEPEEPSLVEEIEGGKQYG